MPNLDLKDWLHLLLSVIALITAVAAWLRKPGEDAQTALQNHIAGPHADLHVQVMTMREQLKHMPTSDELADLEGTVKAIAAQMTALADNVGSVRASQTRIENYLLNAAGR